MGGAHISWTKEINSFCLIQYFQHKRYKHDILYKINIDILNWHVMHFSIFNLYTNFITYSINFFSKLIHALVKLLKRALTISVIIYIYMHDLKNFTIDIYKCSWSLYRYEDCYLLERYILFNCIIEWGKCAMELMYWCMLCVKYTFFFLWRVVPILHIGSEINFRL